MPVTKTVIASAAALALLAGGAVAQTATPGAGSPTPGAGETVKDMPASPHQEELLRKAPDVPDQGSTAAPSTAPTAAGQGPGDVPASPHQQELLTPGSNKDKDPTIAPTGGGTVGDPAATVTPGGAASGSVTDEPSGRSDQGQAVAPQGSQMRK